MKELKEMKVYECPNCKGSGEEIKDWNAHNQLYKPIGFSKKAAEEHARNVEKAYGPCSKCDGKGFILKKKNGK